MDIFISSEPCSTLQHAMTRKCDMILCNIMYRRSDRYINARRKTALFLIAIFLLMTRDLWCHLGDMGHGAHATGNEVLSSPWSPGTMNEEGREAILREISLKQLRWLDWHTRWLSIKMDILGVVTAEDTGGHDAK